MVRYCYLFIVSWFLPTMQAEQLNSRAFHSEEAADHFASDLATGYWSISRIRIEAEATTQRANHRISGRVIAQSERWQAWTASRQDWPQARELFDPELLELDREPQA